MNTVPGERTPPGNFSWKGLLLRSAAEAAVELRRRDRTVVILVGLGEPGLHDARLVLARGLEVLGLHVLEPVLLLPRPRVRLGDRDLAVVIRVDLVEARLGRIGGIRRAGRGEDAGEVRRGGVNPALRVAVATKSIADRRVGPAHAMGA